MKTVTNITENVAVTTAARKSDSKFKKRIYILKKVIVISSKQTFQYKWLNKLFGVQQSTMIPSGKQIGSSPVKPHLGLFLGGPLFPGQ